MYRELKDSDKEKESGKMVGHTLNTHHCFLFAVLVVTNLSNTFINFVNILTTNLVSPEVEKVDKNMKTRLLQ